MLTEAQYKRFGIHDQFVDLVADQMMLKEIFSGPSVIARKRSDPRVAQIIQRMIRRLDRLEDSVTAMEAMLPPPEEDDIEDDDVEDDGGEDGDPAAGQEQRRAAPEAAPEAASEAASEAGKSIVLCPNCSRKLKVESDRIGKIRCPVCKHIFTRTESDAERPARENPPPRLTLPRKEAGARQPTDGNPPPSIELPELDEKQIAKGEAIGVQFSDDKRTLLKYPAERLDAEYAVPDGVTAIGEGAFLQCTNLKKVVIPEGVIAIGSGAFLQCTNLKEVVIPEGVTAIGEGAFGGTNLKEVIIPESVTAIGEKAFLQCTSLKEIVIPEGVTSIREQTFCKCINLTKVIIPKSVTTIEKMAFVQCTSLKEVVIPESVTAIGREAFFHLTKVVIPNGTKAASPELPEFKPTGRAKIGEVWLKQNLCGGTEPAFFLLNRFENGNEMLTNDDVRKIRRSGYQHEVQTYLKQLIAYNTSVINMRRRTETEAAPEAAPEAGKAIVLCPNCSRKLKVASDCIGKIRCPACKHIFTRNGTDAERPARENPPPRLTLPRKEAGAQQQPPKNPPPRLTLPRKEAGAQRQVEENPPTYLDEASPEYDEGLALLCRIGYVCCLIFSILLGLLTLLEVIGLIVIISKSSENGESASSDGLWPIIIAIILSPIMAAGFGMAASWLKKKSRTDRKLQLNRIQLNWGKGLAAVVSFALVFTIAPVKEHFFECAMAGLIFIPIAYALIKFFTNLYRATMQ